LVATTASTFSADYALTNPMLNRQLRRIIKRL
jgi:hypothetical protein